MVHSSLLLVVDLSYHCHCLMCGSIHPFVTEEESNVEQQVRMLSDQNTNGDGN